MTERERQTKFRDRLKMREKSKRGWKENGRIWSDRG